MEHGHIIISHSTVLIFPVNGNVWMSAHQIADLYDVFISAIASNVKSILKNGILSDDKVCRRHSTKTSIVELYSLDMVIALAFRLSSHNATVMRTWVLTRLTSESILPGLVMQSVIYN